MITVIILKKQKIENMAGNIPGRNCQGENFSGVFHQGGSLISGNFPGRTFLITYQINAYQITKRSS